MIPQTEHSINAWFFICTQNTFSFGNLAVELYLFLWQYHSCSWLCMFYTWTEPISDIWYHSFFLQLRFTKGGCQLKIFTINVDFSFSFQARNHTDFLCRMKEYIPSRSVFTDGVIAALGEHFSVQPMDLQAILSSHEEFVPSTKLVSQQDLEEIVSSKESFRV